MARQGYGRHNVVATGSNDATKQVSVNAWNDDIDDEGMLGFTAETIASASSITPSSSTIILSGSTNIDDIALTNTNDKDLLYVLTSGSVTLVNTSSPSSNGQIRLLGNANKDLSTTVPTILMRVGNYWYEYGGITTVSANDLTGTTLASSVVNSSLTQVGTIATGTWQGTAVADSYVASAATWNAKQSALTFGISSGNVTKAGSGIVDNDFIRVDGTTFEGRSASEVLSDIGGQASLTFGIADTNAVKIDGSGSASGEYAKFTTSGIIGEEVADVKTDLSLNNVENTAISTWVGTTNITTLGTIATGTWNGTAVTYANLNLSGSVALADLVAATKTQALIVAASDETTALTTGTAKATFRMPYAFTLTGIRASVTTAPTGSVLTVDVNEGGSTILSTKITIDASEKTSTTAATAPVLSDTALADDAEMTIDIDGVGSTVAGAGLKVALIGYKT